MAMKIMIVGSFCHEIYAPAFSNGFRQLGYDVIEIDYDQFHLQGWGIVSHFLNKIQDRYLYGLLVKKYNQTVIDFVEQEDPKLVFFYRCYHIFNSTLKAIKGKSFIMTYNNDDPFSGVPSRDFYKWHIRNASVSDINYVYRKKNIEDYSKIGINNTKLLLPYYLARKNRQISCHKDIPLAFLGHFENDGRDKLVLSLKNAGLPIVVFGDEMWLKSPLYEQIKDVVFPAKRGAKYNEIINRCQVCLVFFSKLNHDTYTRRCFEIPVTKTVMLCEYTEDMNTMFPEGNCAIYFQNQEELIKKAKELLSNEEYRNEIAQNAYARLQSLGGSEIDRCRQIIEDWRTICEK